MVERELPKLETRVRFPLPAPIILHPVDFKEAYEASCDMANRFAKIEGRPWNAEGNVIELTKQVGDLAKTIMVQERYYYPNRSADVPGYEASVEQIGDELGDILFVVFRLAQHYKIDIEEAYKKALAGGTNYLDKRGL